MMHRPNYLHINQIRSISSALSPDLRALAADRCKAASYSKVEMRDRRAAQQAAWPGAGQGGDQGLPEQVADRALGLAPKTSNG